jgi:aspartate aminotransferase-like enzyme
MEAYEGGGHAYHTTMPTDALIRTRDVMVETRRRGFAKLREQQIELGRACAPCSKQQGYPQRGRRPASRPRAWSSATPTTPACPRPSRFIALGLQTAAGVPLQCATKAPTSATFRIGLFGLEKLADIERTVGHLAQALEVIAAERSPQRKAA